MAFAATKRKRIALKRRLVEPLKITSLVDLLTILLVFLLQNYSSVELTVTPSEDLHLPVSINTKAPIESVQLLLSKQAIVVEGKAVARVTPDFEIEGVPAKTMEIPVVYTALKKQAEIEKQRARRFGREFNGNITIQAHETLPYKLIAKAIFTAGRAEFGNIKFMAFKAED